MGFVLRAAAVRLPGEGDCDVVTVGFGPGFDLGLQGFPGVVFAVDQADLLWRLGLRTGV